MSARTALLLAPRLALGQPQQPRGQHLHALLQRIVRGARRCQPRIGCRGARCRLRLPGRARGLQLLLRSCLLLRAALHGQGTQRLLLLVTRNTTVLLAAVTTKLHKSSHTLLATVSAAGEDTPSMTACCPGVG